MNELPELPNTEHISTWKGEQDSFAIYGYTAEQMKAYALSAVQMERDKQSARHDEIMAVVAEYGRAEWLDGSHATEDALEMKERAFAKVAASIRSPSKEGS